MRLINILNEQLATAKVYYHGTHDENMGKNILNQGIKPGRITVSNKMGAPVENRVYLTPHLDYAIIYCIGANMLGEDIDYLIKSEGRYGYLFEISKENLNSDAQPDEDSIGYILQYVFTKEYYGKGVYYGEKINFSNVDLKWLYDLGSRIFTENQIHNIVHNFDDFKLYKLGKKIVKVMSPKQKQALIDMGTHIAYLGVVKPEKCWKFDKLKNTELKKDGSNFFQLAQRIG